MDRLAGLQQVAGSVSRETLAALEGFESEFRRWSSRINLAALSTLPELWSRHILDSAQLVGMKPEARRWLDLGSGGGFPGAIVAILMRENEGALVELIESNSKKSAFLRTVMAQSKAPARVYSVRIEDAPGKVQQPEIVTARALAPLRDLLAFSGPWLSGGATALFHKGRDYRREIEDCEGDWDFDLVEHEGRLDSESRILEISNLRSRA